MQLSNREVNNESCEGESRKDSESYKNELTSAKQWRRRKQIKPKAETPAIAEVTHCFVIDGQHHLNDKSVSDVKKNEYSALAPAGRTILKEDLQQLQMFSQDSREEANTLDPKNSKAKGRVSIKDD